MVSALDAARPCGEPLRDVGAERRHLGVDVVGGDGDQADGGGLGGVELLAGEEVAAGRARQSSSAAASAR